MASILLVDDDRDTRESLRALLGLMGHQAAAFPDAASALQAVAAHGLRFDVALVDIGLPGLDGCDLVRRLKATPQTGGALFVALTGMVDQSGRAAEAGFERILIKPVQIPRLERLLEEATQTAG
jgi:CheY-like chemotaxis protein